MAETFGCVDARFGFFTKIDHICIAWAGSFLETLFEKASITVAGYVPQWEEKEWNFEKNRLFGVKL